MTTTEQFRGPLVFFSDVHGNLEALDAVLHAVSRLGSRGIYVAGDLLYPGDHPLEVWKRLQEVGARCVRGVSDLALATLSPDGLHPATEADRALSKRFQWTQEALGELILARLRRLPEALRLELPDASEILVVHGAPVDPTEPITLDLSDQEVSALIGTDPADIIVCGASHVAFTRALDDVHVVGVGSVGASPDGRVAHYTLVSPSPEGPVPEQCWVDY